VRYIQNHWLKVFFSGVIFLFILGPFSFASGEIKVLINGQEKQFSPSPIVQNGSTLVPMRPFFEALGAQVEWNGSTKTVIGKRDDTVVSLTINQKMATVNGNDVSLSFPGKIINGNTFIPLRFVGEALGDQVGYNAQTATISITSTQLSQIPTIKVHFIDVGQADSIYIQAPNHYDILIDAGNNEDGSTIVNYLKGQGLDDIELMIATHPHEDHIGGLDDVLKAFDIEEVIDSGEEETTRTYTDYWHAVEEEKTEYLQDQDMTFDLGNGIRFDILETGDGYENVNDNSVLTKLDYHNVEFLFTGDMESDVESKILEKDIQADILKVGHHGSNTSSSEAFLKKVNPKVAVISVGKDNTYGHPHQETLARLTDMGVSIYRTDVSGTIVVSTDGNTYSVNEDPDRISGNNADGTAITPGVPASSGKYLGNMNTKKFHVPDCSSAQKILPENRIWFQIREEALKAGYEPCGICKP